VSLLHAVEVPRRPVSLMEPVIGAARYEQLAWAADRLRPVLAGRTVWNVNSTAAGGGVAEMLQVLVGYVQDLDIPVGWLVITGDAAFFAITKRLHNQIHGHLAGGPLGPAEAGHYAQMLAANAVELLGRVRPGDVVLLHDPQTAGLAAPLAQAGARVVWRCHIGTGRTRPPGRGGNSCGRTWPPRRRTCSPAASTSHRGSPRTGPGSSRHRSTRSPRRTSRSTLRPCGPSW
jgi:trehalose synthase